MLYKVTNNLSIMDGLVCHSYLSDEIAGVLTSMFCPQRGGKFLGKSIFSDFNAETYPFSSDTYDVR